MESSELKTSLKPMEEEIDEIYALQRSNARRVRFLMGFALFVTVVGLLLTRGG